MKTNNNLLTRQCYENFMSVTLLPAKIRMGSYTKVVMEPISHKVTIPIFFKRTVLLRINLLFQVEYFILYSTNQSIK
jgi:hypothetical protein